jgi:hypothetical protein
LDDTQLVEQLGMQRPQAARPVQPASVDCSTVPGETKVLGPFSESTSTSITYCQRFITRWQTLPRQRFPEPWDIFEQKNTAQQLAHVGSTGHFGGPCFDGMEFAWSANKATTTLQSDPHGDFRTSPDSLFPGHSLLVTIGLRLSCAVMAPQHGLVEE